MPLLLVPDGGGALDGPVVAANDGSEGAKHAIQAVGRLLTGRATVVVHAWEPVFHRSLAERALAAGRIDDLPQMVMQLHAAVADSAATTTEEGVAVARAAGLDAVGDTVEADDGASWPAPRERTARRPSPRARAASARRDAVSGGRGVSLPGAR